MKFVQALADKRVLLFWMSLFATAGGWIITLGAWHAAITPTAVGGLFLLLANNVFANMIKNVGIMGAGVTDESDPANQNPPK